MKVERFPTCVLVTLPVSRRPSKDARDLLLDLDAGDCATWIVDGARLGPDRVRCGRNRSFAGLSHTAGISADRSGASRPVDGPAYSIRRSRSMPQCRGMTGDHYTGEMHS